MEPKFADTALSVCFISFVLTELSVVICMIIFSWIFSFSTLLGISVFQYLLSFSLFFIRIISIVPLLPLLKVLGVDHHAQWTRHSTSAPRLVTTPASQPWWGSTSLAHRLINVNQAADAKTTTTSMVTAVCVSPIVRIEFKRIENRASSIVRNERKVSNAIWFSE